LWSPYYRIEYTPARHLIVVNQMGHQQMISRDSGETMGLAYEFPHLLNRDAGRPRFKDVLVIGAGSGNDLSRALQWDVERIDAVEIDPVIQKLGKKHNPDHPYDDSRVTVHLDDGRNFLRSSDKKYDLIIYALVDSLILHSSYSNLRLESYLFTTQALADVRSHLKPDGLFVMYNYFRQGWIVSRLGQEIEEVFGSPPLVITLPYREKVSPEEESHGFVMLLAGDTKPIKDRFAEHKNYTVRLDRPLGPDSPDGFAQRANPDADQAWGQLGPAEILPPAQPLPNATDDWPFLYVRQATMPMLTLRGMGIMGVISCVLIWYFSPRRGKSEQGWSSPATMFLLGAGFMLIETNAVVHMALLFGSTWMVNTIVFFAVLLMVLAANLYVQKVQVNSLLPYFLGLAVALLLNWLVSLDVFLGMNRSVQITGACLLSFAPIFFAGIIFARLFSHSTEPDRAFGANIAGAIAGGLAENFSMLLGFHYLVLLAAAFYALAALLQWNGREQVPEAEPRALEASGASV
jgi:spermidine synthase